MLRPIARHRKLTVGVSVALFTALGLCLNAFTPPVYRATVRIEFPRPADRTPWTGQLGENGSFQAENQSFYTTAELIRSREMLGRLASTLTTREMDQVLGNPQAGPTAWLSNLLHADGMIADAATAGERNDRAAERDRLDLAIHGLGAMVSVEPLRDTRLVDLKVDFPSREEALALSDRLARLFVHYAADQAAMHDTIGLAYLTQQLDQVKQRLAFSENDFAGGGPAAMRARVAVIEGASTGLATSYAAVEADRIATDARIGRMRAVEKLPPAAWIHEPIESETMDALRHALVDCVTRLATSRSIYREKHPKRLALEAERAALEARMRDEMPRAIAALQGQRSVLAAREAELRGALRANERELDAADLELHHGGVREAERKVDEDLHARLLTAVADRQIDQRMRTPPARIVDAATSDPVPVRPRKALNLAVCVFAGLLVGGGVVLLGPPGPVALKDHRRLEEELGLPVVAVVPGKTQSQG
jgi:polysaccharide biosynthesis transport protein